MGFLFYNLKKKILLLNSLNVKGEMALRSSNENCQFFCKYKCYENSFTNAITR